MALLILRPAALLLEVMIPQPDNGSCAVALESAVENRAINFGTLEN